MYKSLHHYLIVTFTKYTSTTKGIYQSSSISPSESLSYSKSSASVSSSSSCSRSTPDISSRVFCEFQSGGNVF
ncbi:hypothetical protein Hanom_Chr11g00969691 [Helianthus anomalus]